MVGGLLYILFFMAVLKSFHQGSDNIANECPEIYGPVVYQARSMYTAIFNDLKVWDDDSCMDVDSSYVAERKISKPSNSGNTQSEIITGGQQYYLFPNPSDGNIELRQLIQDNEPVNVDVTDIVGKALFKEQITFNNLISKMDLSNIASGIYLLQIKDSKGRQYRFKFIVE